MMRLYTVTALCLFSGFAFANNLIDSTLVQVLAERGNTGCHTFHHVTDRELQEAQENLDSLINTNIDVQKERGCVTAVAAELYGSYNADEIHLFNIQAENSDEIFLDVEGNVDLSANSIRFGNIDANGVSEINSNINLGSVELNDARAIVVGNIHINETTDPRSILSIQSQLGIANIDTSLGDVKAGNVIIDKQVLSETKVLTIKQDIALDSSR